MSLHSFVSEKQTMTEQTKQERIRKIYQMLFEMATGNLHFHLTHLNEDDEVDQIADKLNQIANNIKETILKVGHVIPQFTYQNLVQHTFILDKNLIILSYSPSVITTLSYKPEDLIKKPFSKIMTQQSVNDWEVITCEKANTNNINTVLLLNLIDINNQIYPSYFTVSSLINCDKIIVSGITTDLQDYTHKPPINTQKKTENVSIVQRVYDYILNHLEEPLPSIKELAKKFGTNDFKLKEDFRNNFNTSIYKLYTDERLKRATYLIQKTDIPIKEIAFISGFNDYNNFSKAFKKKYNYPPSALKRDI